MSNFKGIVRCKTKSDYDGLTKDSDKLYIVDEETPATMLIEGTYSQITSIAQQSQLTKGSLYKITDYVCVNDELGNGTTGMPVGIILTAVSSNKFSEQCMACSTTVNSVSTETFAQTNSLENFDITEFSIKYSVNNDFGVTTTKGYIYSQCIQYGKGGGGATTLGFDHINMHYVDEKDNLNGGVFSIGSGTMRPFRSFKTTENIFIEFVSTELPNGIEEEINGGRFAIRFDYPIRWKSLKNTSGYPTLPTGTGNSSFVHNLYSNGGDDNIDRGSEIKCYDQLCNSFYFVTSNDIKTKEDGTKYLHIKMSVKDFVNRAFSLDRGQGIETNVFDDLSSAEKNLILDEMEEYGNTVPYVGGVYDVSNLEIGNTLSGSPQRVFATSNGGSESGFIRKTGGSYARDKLFNCLFMLTSNLNEEYFLYPKFISQFIQKSHILEMQEENDIYASENGYLTRFFDTDIQGDKIVQRFYKAISVKPRFCVLKEDWETIGNDGNGGSMFEKKYNQAEQSIVLRIPDVLLYNSGTTMMLLPVFRIIISRYRRK